MKNRFFTTLFFIIILVCAIFALLNPYETAFYCSNALKMCTSSLIPSLFIYMVLSRILSYSSSEGFILSKITSFISRILGLSEVLVPTCIFGLFCGAPSGAFAVSRLYSDGLCTKDEAEAACTLCNNCSAAFILGFAASVTGSTAFSYYILISNILASFTVYMLVFRKTRLDNKKTKTVCREKSISALITGSIVSSFEAVLRLCAFVLFFYTASFIISQRLSDILSCFDMPQQAVNAARAIICSLFEMTSGIMTAGQVGGLEAVMITAFAVSFTGLSVIFQVKSVLSKQGLSSKPFIMSRLLCALLCPIYTLILTYVSVSTATAFAPSKRSGGISGKDLVSLVLITFFTCIGVFILAHLDKKHKNK